MIPTQHMMQDLWPALPGTPAADVQNVRLGLAYVEFLAWAKEYHIERLGMNHEFFVWS